MLGVQLTVDDNFPWLPLGQNASLQRPYEQRRWLLLEWRAARRPMWAKFHAAVAEYQRLRAVLATH